MRPLKASDLAILAAVCFVPVMLCCREHRQTLRVEVPHDFSGPVQVTCQSYGSDLQTTKVDSEGHAVAHACTREAVDVVVVRDGKIVDVGDSLVWAKAGDGIPVGLSFSVR
jgi:hypothetical protein